MREVRGLLAVRTCGFHQSHSAAPAELLMASRGCAAPHPNGQVLRCNEALTWCSCAAAYAGPWGPAAAAKRICAELGLQPSTETLVTEQIRNGLRRYEDWPARDPCAARKRRVLLDLRLDVTLDGLRYTDRMLWDPYTTFAHAADEIGETTCADLGLPGCVMRKGVEAVCAFALI